MSTPDKDDLRAFASSLDIHYTAVNQCDGYRAETSHNNAPRSKMFTTPAPEVVLLDALDALEELARLTALFGFEVEAEKRFTAARQRVADSRRTA